MKPPKPGWATTAICAVAVALPLVPGAARALEWSRDAALGGEPWRWITGHLVHFGAEHLFWNVATFGALAALVERRSRAALLACVALSGLAVTGAIALFAPGVSAYRGLSGIDSALFVWLAVRLLRDEGLRGSGIVAVGALALLAGKLAFEIATGATLFVDATRQDYLPVPLAHIAGGAAGAFVALAPGLFGHAVGKTTTGGTAEQPAPLP